jgi:hypothetical protein
MGAKILHLPQSMDRDKNPRLQRLFENLPELLTPEMLAEVLHTTRGTVYQWKSRPKKYGIPDGLFLKLGRKLLVRREVLKAWVLSQTKGENL